MGRKLDSLFGRIDTLFGRRNKTNNKIKATMNLGISRLSVLKNQRQARFNLARSDVLQLLNLGQHERALLRVEQVVKDQNMMDAYVMIENYFHQLVERINLVESEKTCPEELNEAASSLIYAATRCGDFPELQEIRTHFTSRYGKEFVARAVELRNNCGVNYKLIQKLSTKMPSLDSRMKVLKGIASENNIVLQIEELESENTEDNEWTGSNLAQSTPKTPSHAGGLEKLEVCAESADVGTKYENVAAAAQAAFESAAYAAAAARAAVELSRGSGPHDPDTSNSPKLQPRVMSLTPDDVRGIEEQKVEMGFGKNHTMQKYSSQSEEAGMVKAGQFKQQSKNEDEFKKSSSSSSSDSLDNIIIAEAETFSHNELLRKLQEKDIVFDDSDEELGGKSRTSLTRNSDWGSVTEQSLYGRKVFDSESPYSMGGNATEQSYRKPYSPSHKHLPSRSQAGFRMEKAPEKFMTAGVGGSNMEMKPSSARTKRTFGR